MSCQKRICAIKFVNAYMDTYNKNGTVNDLTELLYKKMSCRSRGTVYMRINKLKQKGVKLPKLRQSTPGSPIDVCTLNKIIRAKKKA